MSVRNKNALKRSRLSAALIASLVVPFAGTALAQDGNQGNQTTAPSSSSTATLDKVTSDRLAHQAHRD